ncbi:O-antigen ligase family protein [Qipengyuania aurantiaca]|uniref:O-antigen ligase family protein n=1 Tax=Qipengyuania aurantiaca TaxID=2867233 RepID=A0ABX8ZP82_9SPHN|nr:O-antigen ligase family protein [Qipengyuania aurantiaca]QZD89458.1 O-antigen ligase family protein [Qipengyuania aurantiaca]
MPASNVGDNQVQNGLMRSKSSSDRIYAQIREFGFSLAIFLLIALILGGGGIRHGLTNLFVQLGGLALLLLWPDKIGQFLSKAPKGLIVLVAATVLLPVMQLVPLPPEVWKALPGREMALESRALVHAENDWFPLTLDRGRTITALFALAGPLAVIVTYRFGSKKASHAGLGILAGLAILQLAYGVLQLAVGGDALLLYETNSEGRFYGFFVGHIASGLFLVIGLCALIGLYEVSNKSTVRTTLFIAFSILLVIGVILTNSRSAVALLCLPGLWALIIAVRRVMALPSRKRWVSLGAALFALVGAGMLMATNNRLDQTWERFEDFEDSRPDIWADTVVGIERYWPVGSGMGTFDEVFQVEESLEALITKKAARAHNEYLEILLEAGIFGVALVIAWLLYLLYAIICGLRTVQAPVTLAAALAGSCIALQALLYFPLRNMAELCVAGLLVALLTAPLTTKRDRKIA